MFAVHAFICAETIIQDIATRRLSAVNLLDDISVVSFPVFIPRLAVAGVVVWDGQGDPKAEGALKVLNNGAEIVEAPFSLEFTKGVKHRAVWNFQGLPIPSPGILRFEMKSGDTVLAAYEIEIKGGKPTAVQVAEAAEPVVETAAV